MRLVICNKKKAYITVTLDNMNSYITTSFEYVIYFTCYKFHEHSLHIKMAMITMVIKNYIVKLLVKFN